MDPRDGNYFVIDDEFITDACIIGVNRVGGFRWLDEAYDEDIDRTLQYARYGFQNQG